ncbi:MAG: PhoH family protein [Candidatus Omnitrophota bacterium]
MENKIKIETQEEARLLFGHHDENVKIIEKEFKVKISLREDCLKISGISRNIKSAAEVIHAILKELREGKSILEKNDIYDLMKIKSNNKVYNPEQSKVDVVESFSFKQIGPRTKGQCEYVEAIKEYDIVFGLGPAGTGKTYLAMASAVEALKNQQVRRIILTRPAIEAGESLGFLPGDMAEKISPYVRPLYDAIYDMMDADTIEKYLETGIIEVAPLAYMRGRTLNDAFIIMDEAQNATAEQMKMFLTRLGFYSKAVITGDITQSDLPNAKPAGLIQSQELLNNIEGIKFIYLTGSDVVRHPLVQKIIQAYDKNAGNR